MSAVLAIRIDDRDRRREGRTGEMVIDHHDIDTQFVRPGQRIDAGRSAVDGHDECRAACDELLHGFAVGAVALEQPVGDVDRRRKTNGAKEPVEQRGGSRSVHVVIAEDRDRLLRAHGVRDPRGSGIHVGQRAGSGIRRRTVGSRKSTAVSAVTPRPARMRASSSGRSLRCAMAIAAAAPRPSQAARSSAGRSPSARPRGTPATAPQRGAREPLRARLRTWNAS